jgi:hypothetical protein
MNLGRSTSDYSLHPPHFLARSSALLSPTGSPCLPRSSRGLPRSARGSARGRGNRQRRNAFSCRLSTSGCRLDSPSQLLTTDYRPPPLSLIIPAHTGGSPVTPIIPALTQPSGGGGPILPRRPMEMPLSPLFPFTLSASREGRLPTSPLSPLFPFTLSASREGRLPTSPLSPLVPLYTRHISVTSFVDILGTDDNFRWRRWDRDGVFY